MRHGQTLVASNFSNWVEYSIQLFVVLRQLLPFELPLYFGWILQSLQSTIPLERKLPEPYKTTWLQSVAVAKVNEMVIPSLHLSSVFFVFFFPRKIKSCGGGGLIRLVIVCFLFFRLEW